MVDGCHTAPSQVEGRKLIAMRRLAPSRTGASSKSKRSCLSGNPSFVITRLRTRQRLGRLSATENDEIVGIGDEVRSARFAASGTQSISAIGSIGKLCHDKPA
jgi:hypothetical protein